MLRTQFRAALAHVGQALREPEAFTLRWHDEGSPYHWLVFAGVGVSMIDTFARIMARLEPSRGRAPAFWLLLVGAIGGELFYAFGLFNFLTLTQSPLWLAS